MVPLTQLAYGSPAGTHGRCAAQDQGREDDAKRDAADNARSEPGLRAVVGGLLHLSRALARAVRARLLFLVRCSSLC